MEIFYNYLSKQRLGYTWKRITERVETRTVIDGLI